MIFSQYTETCELILDYTKLGGEDIKYFAKKAIRNLLHADIDVQTRILIDDFKADGTKCIENCNKIVQT